MAGETGNTTVRKNATLMISYSRKDLVFVRQVFEGLLAQGFAREDIWVDWEGIPLTADWRKEITKGIQSANAFIFVISPDSVASKVCAEEIAIAAESNKRFVPIVHRQLGKDTVLHPKISSHNWVFMRDQQELEKTLPALVEALNTDLDWLAQHTRLQNRALEWKSKSRNESYLVRGADLQEAQSFIEQGAAGKEPSPTALQVEYVQAARQHAAAIRRRNRIIAAVVGAVLFGLTIFSLVQWSIAEDEKVRADNNRGTAVVNEQIARTKEAEAIAAQAQAEREARVANAQALAAEAFNQKDNDTQLALMLALLSIQETEPDHIMLPESRSALFATLNSPNVLHTFPGNGAIVWSVAYDPQGDYVAFGDTNGVLSIWKAEGREPVHEISFGEISIYGMDFSPDGNQLGIALGNEEGGDGAALVLDVESGEELFSLAGHDGYAVNDFDFSPDGSLIATGGGDWNVRLWNAGTGSLVVTLPGHTAAVNSIEFGPDGSQLVSGSDDDTAIVWDLETDSLIFKLRPDGFETEGFSIYSVAFNPWGDRILTGGYKTVVVWDAIDGTAIHRLRGNQAAVWDLAFAPDGLSMLTASSGIKIWDYFYGTERYNLSSHRGEVTSAAFSSDGQYLLTGSWDNTAKLWSARLLIETLKMDQNVYRNLDANYSRDGKWIVTTDETGNVIIHDARTGEVVSDWTVPDTGLEAASFDPQNSQRVVTGGDNGQVIVWILGQDEPVLVIDAHDGRVASAVFDPDGRTILSASEDGTARVWNAENGSQLLVLEDDYDVNDARFSDDGSRIATSNSGNTARIWDAGTGEELLQLTGHTDYVLAAIFSHDGNYVFTGSYDNTIRKWDANTGEELLTLAGHTGRVEDLDISPDDTLLVSGSADTTVKVWDLITNNELYTYRGNNETTNSVAFNSEGSRVLTASSDETTKEFTIDYEELLQVAGQYELRALTEEECQGFLNRDDCRLHLFEETASAPLLTPTPPGPLTSTPAGPSGQAVPTVTATAEAPRGAGTPSFYTEEFDGDIDTWSTFMTSGIETQVNMTLGNGVLSVQLSPHEDEVPWVHFINNAFTYNNVQVEVVTTNNGNNANGVGLVCRYSDKGWYEFQASNAGLYSIYAFDAAGAAGQGYDQLANGGSPAIQFGHVTNVYTAVCRDDELTLLVNGTPVSTINDTVYNFTEGKIGIAVSSPQTLPVDVQIESVTVSEP